MVSIVTKARFPGNAYPPVISIASRGPGHPARVVVELARSNGMGPGKRPSKEYRIRNFDFENLVQAQKEAVGFAIQEIAKVSPMPPNSPMVPKVTQALLHGMEYLERRGSVDEKTGIALERRLQGRLKGEGILQEMESLGLPHAAVEKIASLLPVKRLF